MMWRVLTCIRIALVVAILVYVLYETRDLWTFLGVLYDD